MLLYVHGYQGSPGDKFDRVVKIFGDMFEDIRAPQLSNLSVASDLEKIEKLLPKEAGETPQPRPLHLIVGTAWEASTPGTSPGRGGTACAC